MKQKARRAVAIARMLQWLRDMENATHDVAVFRARVEETLRGLMDGAPSGSGFDAGTSLDYKLKRGDRFTFTVDYHHMNDNGMYAGWTQHAITVWPDWSHDGFDFSISGRNRNGIKEYIGDVFSAWLREEVMF